MVILYTISIIGKEVIFLNRERSSLLLMENPKSEYLNSKQIQIVQCSNIKIWIRFLF